MLRSLSLRPVQHMTLFQPLYYLIRRGGGGGGGGGGGRRPKEKSSICTIAELRKSQFCVLR